MNMEANPAPAEVKTKELVFEIGNVKRLFMSWKNLIVWRLSNYFWFHPETLEFAGFQLVNSKYEMIAPTGNGWLWSDSAMRNRVKGSYGKLGCYVKIKAPFLGKWQ